MRIRHGIENIVFIEPRPPSQHVFTRMPLPRLGTVILGTILRNHGYEVTIFVESIHEIDFKRLLSADAVGISTTTSTAPRAYEIASLLKGKIPVFMGGPHVTYLPNEALEHCNFVLRGEADDCIVDFIQALENERSFENIPGLSYRKGGMIIHNHTPATCKDLDKLPCPDFSLIAGLEESYTKKLGITPVMTSRGCPYDCSFCSVTGMFGQKYRFRSNERVMEELRRHKKNNGKWVFFYDDNFCANKERTKELLREMIKERVTPRWTAQVRVEVAKDPELLDLMAQSGCHTVYIGFESVNPETLKAYNKKQSVEDIRECIKALHKRGIRIHGMFVFGSDEDTIHTIRETVAFAKKNKLNSVQFLILTPLPGTRCYLELAEQKRIINTDWSLYDTHHVVFRPMRMTPYELQQGTVDATKAFYSLWPIVRRVISFDLFSASIKAYGYSLAREWEKKNRYFIDYTKQIPYAGKAFELAARKTAEDLKQRFFAHFHNTPGK